MTLFLKIFWMTVLTVFVGGLITLSVMGIPAPTVHIKKELPIETLLK